MNHSIITFIITGTDNDFHMRISQMKNLNKYGKPVLLHSTEQLESILTNMNGGFMFKLLIHGDEQISNDFKGKYYIDELKEFLNIEQFDIISGKLINKEVDYNYKNIKGFVRHNIDVINTTEFISSLKTYRLSEVLKKEVILGNIESGSGIDKSKTDNVPIAITTALLADEYNVCKNLMDGREDSQGFQGKFKDLQYDKDIRLYTQNDRMGMVESSILCAEVIRTQRPELIFLGGVCGGRKGKVRLYDVVIPSLVIDIITGKLECDKKTQSDVFRPFGYLSEAKESLMRMVKGIVTGSQFKMDMLNCIPKGEFSELNRLREIISNQKFSIHTEVMACGSFVVKRDDFINDKANQINDKICAYEMESYGFMRTCFKHNKLSLVVKSVMDYTDSKKTDINSEAVMPINEDGIPANEDIKRMASIVSFICIKALITKLDLARLL